MKKKDEIKKEVTKEKKNDKKKTLVGDKRQKKTS